MKSSFWAQSTTLCVVCLLIDPAVVVSATTTTQINKSASPRDTTALKCIPKDGFKMGWNYTNWAQTTTQTNQHQLRIYYDNTR